MILKKKFDNSSYLAMFFGGFTVLVATLIFIYNFDIFSFEWYYSVLVMLINPTMMIGTLYKYILNSKNN